MADLKKSLDSYVGTVVNTVGGVTKEHAPTAYAVISCAAGLYGGLDNLPIDPAIAGTATAAGTMCFHTWKGNTLAHKLRDKLSELPIKVQAGVHASIIGGAMLLTNTDLDVSMPSSGTDNIDDTVELYLDSLDLGSSETAAVYAHPIGKPDQAYVSINKDEVIRSASANKVYVMMAAYALTKPNQNDLRRMITLSNNSATNRLIRAVGGEDAVNEYIQGLGISDTTVKYIPTSGRTLDNITTLEDLSTAYSIIYNEDVTHATQMISVLNDSPHRDRLVDGTSLHDGDGYVLGYRIDDVFHKTGSINGVNIDVGIIEADFNGKMAPYFIGIAFDDPTVGPSTGSPYAEEKSPIMREISEMVFAEGVYPLHSDGPGACKKYVDHHGVAP